MVAFAGRQKVLALLMLVLSACTSGTRVPTSTASSEIARLEELYRTAWLSNDSAAVMATLERDAVLMPAGMNPLIGDSAIRAYWWPADGSRTTIKTYDIAIDEIGGTNEIAFLRGRAKLSFTYQNAAGQVSNAESESVHFSLARRGADGKWRIARRAWSRIR